MDEMMGSLKDVIVGVSKDKNLDKAIIIDALEQAVIHAARKYLGATADLEAHYREESDEIELFQFRTVVEDDDVADDALEISLSDAHKLDGESVLGDALGVKVDTSDFGRIAAQSAKQIIVQKVRDAERAQIYEEFKDRVGEVMSGYVRRFERSDIIVDLGRTEAVLPYRDQVPTERYRVKDRIQGYVKEIRRASRGPQIVLSRAHPNFLISLFEQNVTEIYDGIVTIEAVARDPGYRSKIAVYSKDSSVDPVGACVGPKGSRVTSVGNELNGEKVDVILFDRDPARLVCNALQPAVVSKVIVDEDNQSMEVIVADDQLSLAIGKRGQNVRLAAQLTGWRLDIKSESKVEERTAVSRKMLAAIEGLGEIRAEILLHEGLETPEQVGELEESVLMRALNIDSEEAATIIENARTLANEISAGNVVFEDTREADARAELLANSSAAPKHEEKSKSEEDALGERVNMFLELSGVGEATAHALAEAGYGTIGDVVADTADEVAQKTGLPLGVARTVQMAADRYLQE